MILPLLKPQQICCFLFRACYTPLTLPLKIMPNKSSSILIFAFGFMIAAPYAPLWAANDRATIDTSQQLTSQAESFREEQKKKPLTPQEKPQIVQKKEKENCEYAESTLYGNVFTLTRNAASSVRMFEEEAKVSPALGDPKVREVMNVWQRQFLEGRTKRWVVWIR